MKLYKNLPVRYKLLSVYVVISVIVFSLNFLLLYSQVQRYLEKNVSMELERSNKTVKEFIETTASLSVKNHLKTIASQNKKIISGVFDRYMRNEIPEAEARKEAARLLLSQKVGDTGYVYCVDSDGIVVVHPDRKVLWQSFSYMDFVQEQIKKKGGYLEYDWKNPDENEPRKKALYMVYFEPWDWIISVSSYKSEFNRLVDVENFKPHVKSLTFGETGYSFIFDRQGNNLIHPELTGNIFNSVEPERAGIIKKMINQKNGTLSYRWKRAGDKEYRDKLAVFHHIPDFDWIIASSSYKDEVFLPLFHIRSLFIMILAFSIVLIGFASLLISSSITKPLSTLVRYFEEGIAENFSTPLAIINERNDEIGKLSESFNQFMARLHASRKELLLEIQTRKEAENQLSLFEKVFENVGEGISVTDENGSIEEVNQAFTTITGYKSHEVIGQNPRILKSDRHDEAFYKNMWDTISDTGNWTGEIWNRRKNGEAYPELLSISAIKEKNNNVKKYIAVFRDISDMKTKEAEIEKLAYHDPLTLLPNRTLLSDRLKQAIFEAGRSRKMVQILYIDLDNFKTINDSMGHPLGDALLKEAARRMASVVRSGDTVSRVGGDEFIIIIPNIISVTDVALMVDRFQEVFKEPFRIDTHTFHVSCSIGVAVYPNDGETSDILIKHADLAMYQSKKRGRNCYSLFENQMAQVVNERVRVESELRYALKNDEFQVYFQPRVDNKNYRPLGMEALARWIKKDGTIVPPNVFIPIAEESGLIVPIGEKIFESAVVTTLATREKTGLDLSVSINVSIRQFNDSNFEPMVKSLLEKTGFPENRLEIEVTETLLVSESDNVIPILNSFSSIGVKSAIDDFGTGYSSLAYIQKLPINTLKIDKSFIDKLDGNPENSILVETIILMANKLKLKIVAEGVETEEQLAILNQLGEMEIQGYLFARPMPVDALEAWLVNR